MLNAEVNLEGPTTSEFSIQTSAFSVAEGGSNSVVESQPSKLLVAGSIPVSRSSLRLPSRRASAWQATEQVSREGCRAEARSAKADHVIRRKVVWGS